MRTLFTAASATALALLLVSGSPAEPATPAGQAANACLPGSGAFLRATLRSALNADIDWRDTQISCEGSDRPDGRGLRITVAGPLPAVLGLGPRRLRFVFGIDTPGPGGTEQALPTNLTVILEGEQQLFATRGDDKCTTDRLRRSDPPPGAASPTHVEARGFCTRPASTLDGSARLLISTFDFAASLSTEPTP